MTDAGGASSEAVQEPPHKVVPYPRSYADGYVSTWRNHPLYQRAYAIAGLMMAEADEATWAAPAGPV